MKKLQVLYPWQQLEKGQSFFVPCLDTQPVREEGLRKALGLRLYDARATVGVKHGKLGVIFYRTK
jgi:hypothetical protein